MCRVCTGMEVSIFFTDAMSTNSCTLLVPSFNWKQIHPTEEYETDFFFGLLELLGDSGASGGTGIESLSAISAVFDAMVPS